MAEPYEKDSIEAVILEYTRDETFRRVVNGAVRSDLSLVDAFAVECAAVQRESPVVPVEGAWPGVPSRSSSDGPVIRHITDFDLRDVTEIVLPSEVHE